MKEIANLGPSKDWQSNLLSVYREVAQEGALGIPKALFTLLATAPEDFGKAIRAALAPTSSQEKFTDSPSHEVGAGASSRNQLRAGPHCDLLPLPWSPEVPETFITPVGRRLGPAYTEGRRMWMLLMLLVLNFQHLGTSALRERPHLLLGVGPPSPAQGLALGLLGQSADVLLERGERHPVFKDWEEELRSR